MRRTGIVSKMRTDRTTGLKHEIETMRCEMIPSSFLTIPTRPTSDDLKLVDHSSLVTCVLLELKSRLPQVSTEEYYERQTDITYKPYCLDPNTFE